MTAEQKAQVMRTARDEAIRAFLDQFAPSKDSDLLAGMMTTICRLASDAKADRGELKILDSALKELRYAFKTFAPYRDIRKVSIFGSARTAPEHPDYIQAARFAERICRDEWMVITGAGGGVMAAGHGGAGAKQSFGVSIRLPFEEAANAFIAEDQKLVSFKYFFTRKLMFIKEASAVALFPGGFGTQDECFEALTLVQTGKAVPIPIVMVDAPGGTYWQHWRTYVSAELLRTGMISPDDTNLFHLTDDFDNAARYIVQFYKNYHSSRYVRDKLVIRLNGEMSDDSLEQLNDAYADILTEGKILPAETASVESDDHPEKPRISMAFNRRNMGRLLKMIHTINTFELRQAREPRVSRR
jgi:hypothetical protein